MPPSTAFMLLRYCIYMTIHQCDLCPFFQSITWESPTCCTGQSNWRVEPSSTFTIPPLPTCLYSVSLSETNICCKNIHFFAGKCRTILSEKKNRGALPSSSWKQYHISFDEEERMMKYFIQTVATWMFVPWRLVKQLCWSVNIRFLIMKSFNLHFSLY